MAHAHELTSAALLEVGHLVEPVRDFTQQPVPSAQPYGEVAVAKRREGIEHLDEWILGGRLLLTRRGPRTATLGGGRSSGHGDPPMWITAGRPAAFAQVSPRRYDARGFGTRQSLLQRSGQ